MGEESDNRRILVVDDNRFVHEDFRKVLEAAVASDRALDDLEETLFGEEHVDAPVECFQLDSAFQGEEGVAKVREAVAQERPYAVVFVDVRMPPGCDGVKALSQMWEIDPDLQAVVCTAFSDYSWEQMSQELTRRGNWIILKKPFDKTEVQQLACALCDKWNLGREARRRIDVLDNLVRERTQALLEAERKLLHQDKLACIGQLAAGVAHEINTPIQYVGDNLRALCDSFDDLIGVEKEYRELVQLLRSGQPTDIKLLDVERVEHELELDYVMDDVPKAIAQSQEGVRRVAQIVASLKAFAHVDHGEHAETDLNACLASTLAMARNSYKYVADLETQFGELPPVRCCAGEIGQVFLNLIVNAVHAIEDTKRHGKIIVRTGVVGDVVEIAISDTGTGIPEAIRPRVFDPFYTTKEAGKGTGQGLAIAEQIVVAKHKGTLTFESEVGVGTTFHIRLPLHHEGTAEPSSTAATIG